MAEAPHPFQELGWLLDDLVARVAAVRHAVVLSDDGLVAGVSRGFSREDAEHLSAIAFSMHTLAEGTARRFHTGAVHHTVTAMDDGCLFVASGAGTVLAVLTAAQAETELIAYEMNRLARRAAGRIGAHAGSGN